jgi:hypothetical protein
MIAYQQVDAVEGFRPIGQLVDRPVVWCKRLRSLPSFSW